MPLSNLEAAAQMYILAWEVYCKEQEETYKEQTRLAREAYERGGQQEYDRVGMGLIGLNQDKLQALSDARNTALVTLAREVHKLEK